MSDYRRKAKDDAANMFQNVREEILDQLMKGTDSDDWNNDYPNVDSYPDREYSLQEAVTLLDELSDEKETDSGLWEGQDPRDAIIIQAVYTYDNAVWRQAGLLAEEINERAQEIMERFDGETDRYEGKCREALSRMIDEVCK